MQVIGMNDLKGNVGIAVKILRPNIEKDFARDIEMLFWVAEIAEGRIPKRLKPREVVQTFSESIKMELDLRLEAAAREARDDEEHGRKRGRPTGPGATPGPHKSEKEARHVETYNRPKRHA